MNLREFILNTVLNKNGQVNAKADYSEVIDVIFLVTCFLPDEASLSERLFCIKHEITELKRCPFCLRRASFEDYRGYKITCGDKCCGLRFRHYKRKIKHL